MSDEPRETFRSLVASNLELPANHVSLFARGRVALWAILRALRVSAGDEVILPAFTCVAVPNAIIYAGAKPVWVDIDASTYVVDPRAVEAAIRERTKVILAQNTFGLSADLERIAAAAATHGITLVDDCAHGLGGRYRGRPNGSTAPASFFSTQWSKPISTGLGGIAVARDVDVASRIRALERSMPEPSAAGTAILQLLIRARNWAGSGRMLPVGRATYRWLSHSGLVPGSSNRTELEGTRMPQKYLTRLAAAQASVGSRQLRTLDAQVERRRSIGHRYSEWLRSHNLTPAGERPDSMHAFLRYPLRVRDQAAFRREATRARIDLGDWFVSPIHPVVDDLDRWGYRAGSAPCAEQACREVVNLPTDSSLEERDIDRILDFLDRHQELIA